MTIVIWPDQNGGVVQTSIMPGANLEKAIEQAVPRGLPYKVVAQNEFDFCYQEAIRWNDGDPIVDTSLLKAVKLANGELAQELSSQFQTALVSLQAILTPEQEADFFLIEAAIEKALNRGRFHAVMALLKKPQDLPEAAEAVKTDMVKTLEGLLNGS